MSVRLITAPEVADLLRVDLETVRRRTRRREIPAINIASGRKPTWRYDEAEIRAWLDQRRSA